LNQYDSQGMFGNPVLVNPDDAVFHLLWTYNVKALDGCKKAHCVCDGSSRSGSVTSSLQNDSSSTITI
jgi:hypothetical protein